MRKEIWIARDMSGETFGYNEEPEYDEDREIWLDKRLRLMASIPDNWFPDIKPGECKKFVMIEE